jgi:cardiolipin synthase
VLEAADWSALFSHYLGVPMLPGHSIERLLNGREIFPDMLAAIESASRSIELISFIFWRGKISERFCDALIERADRGVSVRVMLDAVGSRWFGNRLLGRLEESAVELRMFSPVPNWKFWRMGSRNHRKILVVDNRVAYTGGVGIADEWDGDADQPDHFRETHFRITGPAVAQMKGAFYANWAGVGGRLPEPLESLPIHSLNAPGIPAAVVPSSAAEQWSKTALLFRLLLRGAAESLTLVTPYFVPGQLLASDIANAARRGVETRIFISGRRSDHLVPRWAGRRYYADLLKVGVEILEYDLTLMHTKLVIVDDRLVCFGSPNMNQRSQYQDEEIAVLCQDESLVDTLHRDLDFDRRHCRRIDPDRWAQRPAWQRLLEWAAAPFEAQS